MAILKPLGNRLIIEKDERDAKSDYTTESGIRVVQSNDSRKKGRMALGTIKAVGTSYINPVSSKRENLADTFSVGDRILYYLPSEKKIKYGDEEFTFIRAEDVDCIVPEGMTVDMR